MARQHSREGQPGGEDRQQNPQGGAAGQAGADTGKSRQQTQEGQNQSAPPKGEGGRPGQANDLAAMEGQQVQRGGQQGQPDERGQSDGERGGNR